MCNYVAKTLNYLTYRRSTKICQVPGQVLQPSGHRHSEKISTSFSLLSGCSLIFFSASPCSRLILKSIKLEMVWEEIRCAGNGEKFKN